MFLKPRRIRSFGRRGAFSLIELMVVLAVMGILSALIVPQFTSGLEDTRLLATGRELLSVLNLAYSQAVTLHRPCRMRLDLEKGRYWLESPAEGERGERGFTPLADVPGSSGELDRRISIQVRRPSGMDGGDRPRSPKSSPGGSSYRGSSYGGSEGDLESFDFRPDGTAEPREIILRDREGFGLSLEIHSITSRVRLTDLEREAVP